ncbi:hypothetical protein VNI00_004846 [Paramarasmius palmivorus]|uniref:Uncharacterized protein n=1 Tax=Paramarasmius palmivorus TaxID=297713 RepID=A0AAW0DIZ8_9AGAR
MVHFASAAIAFSALFTVASAAGGGPKILRPGPDNWWVAKSDNVIEWDCKTSSVTEFIVVIADQQNSDCSKLVTQQQMSMPAATGYKIQFANRLNQTDVYSESEEFEIKPLGSAYPSQATPSGTTSSSNSSETGTSAGANTGEGNSASSLQTPLAFGAAALGVFIGLIAA